MAKLPPVIVAVALINPPVYKLPPVMLPVTDTVVPVCVVALTLAPPKIFPPVMLPVAEINPLVSTLPANVPVPAEKLLMLYIETVVVPRFVT